MGVCEVGAGGRHILIQLFFEGFDALEFHLGSDEFFEGEVHFDAVDVAVKIEQVGFDSDAFAIEGWADADVGHSHEGFIAEGSSPGIDAVARYDLVLPNIDVRRREANGTPSLKACDDASGDAIRAIEQGLDGFKFALPYQVANLATADGRLRCGGGDEFKGGDGEAFVAPLLTEEVDCAFALITEGEVFAYPERLHAQMMAEFIDEIGGALLAGGFVEGMGDDHINAQIEQVLSAFIGGGEVVASEFAMQDDIGMGEEGQDDCLARLLMGERYNLADKRLMSDVNAIKHANGDEGVVGHVGIL